jgi:hypothetical protein
MKQIKVHSTAYPPKQPSLMKWMQDYRVGVRIDQRSLAKDRSSKMNLSYNFQKLNIR